MDYKGYKFYLFGCSHTANVHCDTFPFFDNSVALAYGGNSNDRIIRNLKESILEVTDNLTKKVDNVYFNIQFTYFNRLEIYSDMDSQYFTFHSPNFKNQHSTTNYDLGEQYDDFYKSWLTYFFNEEQRLKELLVECRILKNLMDSFGIKHNWYLWAGLHLPEIKNTNKELLQKNIIFEKDFEELNFQKFDDYWYYEDYAIHHKMRNCDITGNEDCHIESNTNKIVAEMIRNRFEFIINKDNI
jgi:hypothetical protein